MIRIHYITNAEMQIDLENMFFGKHVKDPSINIKHFSCNSKEIEILADKIGQFTDWGVIELVPENKKQAIINVSIDVDNWACIGTAQILIEKDGQVVFNDNFQSGMSGPIGHPKKTKSYPIN